LTTSLWRMAFEDGGLFDIEDLLLILQIHSG
jgi:hypothetical protein